MSIDHASPFSNVLVTITGCVPFVNDVFSVANIVGRVENIEAPFLSLKSKIKLPELDAVFNPINKDDTVKLHGQCPDNCATLAVIIDVSSEQAIGKTSNMLDFCASVTYLLPVESGKLAVDSTDGDIKWNLSSVESYINK
jgi:hypothetical protein